MTADEENAIIEAMGVAFIKMSIEEKALVLVAAEKMERGETNEDGMVRVTVTDHQAMIARLGNTH